MLTVRHSPQKAMKSDRTKISVKYLQSVKKNYADQFKICQNEKSWPIVMPNGDDFELKITNWEKTQ